MATLCTPAHQDTGHKHQTPLSSPYSTLYSAVWMEGYTNSGFAHSISSGLTLKTKSLLASKSLDGHYAETLREAAGLDPETDLDSGSFLSDLEKDSGRKDEAVLAGYCDRSFEKAILSLTNEATLDLSEPDGRQGVTLSVAAPSMNSQRLRGSRRFTPRPAPETIPEESEVNVVSRDGEGRISLQLEDGGRRKQKPQPRLSNLCGLIDTDKLTSVLGGRTRQQTSAASLRPGLALPTNIVEGGERREEGGERAGEGRLSGSDLAGLAGLLALVLLVVSHASPSWLVSWQDTQSPFVRMGPWQICFNRFRFPRLQFDVLFHGCSSMWGRTFHQIREWLMPPWLLAVQGLLCLSLLLSCLSRLLSLLSVFQSPREVWLRFGYYFLLVNVFCDLLVGLVMFTSSLLFCFSCWSRSWLLYPNYNYLSWGWAAALLSSWAHLATTLLSLAEARRQRARRPQYQELLLQLQPVQPGVFGQEGIYI